LTNVAYSPGGTLTIGWDDTNRVTSRSFDAGTPELRLEYTRNDRDAVTEVRRYSDAAGTTLIGKTTLGYDDGGRVTSIHHKEADGDTIDHLQYEYDAGDRVLEETSTLGPTRNYGYDDTDQLTSDGTDSWTFDANGNRTLSGYETGDANQALSDGTWDYEYDDEGNQVQRTNISTNEIWINAFDHNNRLTKVEHKDSSTDPVDYRVEMKYDVFGNWIQKSVDADGDGSGTAVVTKFAFDPTGNAWADLNSSGAITTRRFYEDAVDALFARMAESSGAEAWYLTDRLGSVRDILDASGTLIDHIDYESFGKVSNETSPSNGDRFKFTAREQDSDIPDLQYNRNRWYQFDVGLFLSQDPIGFAAGDGNLYRYVGNNPANLTDPSGLDPDPLDIIGFGQQYRSSAPAGNMLGIRLGDTFSQNGYGRFDSGGDWRVTMGHAMQMDIRFRREYGQIPADGVPPSQHWNAWAEFYSQQHMLARQAQMDAAGRPADDTEWDQIAEIGTQIYIQRLEGFEMAYMEKMRARWGAAADAFQFAIGFARGFIGAAFHLLTHPWEIVTGRLQMAYEFAQDPIGMAAQMISAARSDPAGFLGQMAFGAMAGRFTARSGMLRRGSS
jgi:RHS repeat-associated protein